MTGLADMFAAARSVRIEDELARRGIKLRGGGAERYGPCPVCGGTDRFSINTKKQLWNCRGCAKGGDVIDLVRHIDGLDFKETVAALAGHTLPQKRAVGGQVEPEEAVSGLPSDDTKRNADSRLALGLPPEANFEKLPGGVVPSADAPLCRFDPADAWLSPAEWQTPTSDNLSLWLL